MKPKFTMALAVLAVAFMMGSALVPLASSNGYDSEAASIVYSTNEEAVVNDQMDVSDLSFGSSDILATLSMLLANSGLSLDVDISTSTLIPVDNNTDYKIMTKWDGKSVTGSRTVGLYEGASVTLTSDAHIGKGSTLVLFPASVKTDLSFTVSSDNPSYMVFLDDGAFIDVFGLKFKYISDESITGGYCIFKESYGTLNVVSGIKDGKFTAYVELGKHSYFDILFGKMINLTENDQTLLNAAVKVTAGISAEKNKVSFSDIDVIMKSQFGEVMDNQFIDLTVSGDSITVTNSASSAEKGKMEIAYGAFTGSIAIMNGEGESAEPVIQISGLSSPAVRFSIEVDVKQVTVGEEKKLASTFDMTMSFDDKGSFANAEYVSIGGMGVAKNVAFSIDQVEVKFISDPVAVSNEIYVNIVGEFEYKMESISVSTGLVTVTNDSSSSDVTIKGLSFKISDATLDVKIGGSMSVETYIGYIGLEGKVSYPSMIPYPITFGLSGSGVSVSFNDGAISASADEISIKATVRYDGLDRTVAAEVTGLSFTMSNGMAAGIKVKAKTISVSCNVPFKTMNLFLPYNIDLSAYAKNICFEMGSEGIKLSGDYINVDSRTQIPNAPYLEAIYVEVSNFGISGEVLEAESVSGYLKNFGENNQNFSISKKGSDKPAFSLVLETGIAIKIEKGNASFNAGYIPADIIVGKDTVFVADGLSANNFSFEKGAILSGVVALDTAESTKDGSRRIAYDGLDLVVISPLKEKLASAGYKVLFDIGTLGGGKLIACYGTSMPEWKSDYGTKWTVSNDRTYATYDTGTGASFCFETDPNTYKFSYSGEEAVDKKYGETVTLKEIPAKDKMAPIGWADGSGDIFKVGSEYRMPARNVVLTAQYTDVAPNVAVKDKEVLVKSEVNNSLVVGKSSLDKVVKGGNLTISVVGAEVSMGKETINGLKSEFDSMRPGEDLNLMFSVNKATDINDDVKKKIVGNGTMYNIKLESDQGDQFTYSNGEIFRVTLDFEVSGKVDHFNVSYIGDDYSTHKVGTVSFNQTSDSLCEVTVDCNHFSDYIIEPVYKSTDWGEVAVIIVLTVVIVAVVFIAAARVSKARRN